MKNLSEVELTDEQYEEMSKIFEPFEEKWKNEDTSTNLSNLADMIKDLSDVVKDLDKKGYTVDQLFKWIERRFKEKYLDYFSLMFEKKYVQSNDKRDFYDDYIVKVDESEDNDNKEGDDE